MESRARLVQTVRQSALNLFDLAPAYLVHVGDFAARRIRLRRSTIRYLSTAHRVGPYAIAVPHAA
eukprot:2629209-Rhodomonas_salina.2